MDVAVYSSKLTAGMKTVCSVGWVNCVPKDRRGKGMGGAVGKEGVASAQRIHRNCQAV